MLGMKLKFKAFLYRDEGLSYRKIAERIAADIITEGLGLDPPSHASVSNWLKNEGFKAAWEHRKRAEADREIPSAPPKPRPGKPSRPPKLGVIKLKGALGLTEKSELKYTKGLKAGASKRTSAHSAGLTEPDVVGWEEEAVRGVEPFVSAMRRIRAAVADDIIEICILVKSGEQGFQARIRWLAVNDDTKWNDKPRLTESDQDRAAGIPDGELWACIDEEAIAE